MTYMEAGVNQKPWGVSYEFAQVSEFFCKSDAETYRRALPNGEPVMERPRRTNVQLGLSGKMPD